MFQPRLGEHSEPQPDLPLPEPRAGSYAIEHLGHEDAILVVSGEAIVGWCRPLAG